MSETQENKTQSALYEKILLTVIIIVAVVALALTILNAANVVDIAEWIEDLADVFLWALFGLYCWQKEWKGLAIFWFVRSGVDVIFAVIAFLQWVNG